MSAGRWNYVQDDCHEALQTIGNDAKVIRRFPRLAEKFRNLSATLTDAVYAIDLDFSGDKQIKDDREFEADALARIESI